MPITTKTVAVIAVLLLMDSFVAGWFLRTPAPEVAPQPPAIPTEVVFGALLPLSGDLSSLEETSETALEERSWFLIKLLVKKFDLAKVLFNHIPYVTKMIP